MTIIHCKVSFNEEFRRIQFPSDIQFVTFRSQIVSLLKIEDGGELVLKYKDDESDLVFISCDEELQCAIAHSAGLIRLFVEVKPMENSVAPAQPTCPDSVTVTPDRHSHGGRGCGRGNWKGNGPRGRHGPHGHGRHGDGPRCKHGKDDQFYMQKLSSKRDLIAAVLADPDACDEHKKQKLQRKLDSIDRRLTALKSKVSETTTTVPSETVEKYEIPTEKSEESESSNEWRKKKSDKKYRKSEKKCSKRKSRKNLSEEAKKEVSELKSQIWQLKPSLNRAHIQIYEKKALLAEARNKQDSQAILELKKQIFQLKEIKKEHKRAIAPLKQRIRALKFEEC